MALYKEGPLIPGWDSLGWFLCSLLDMLSFSAQSTQMLLLLPPARPKGQTATEGQKGSGLLWACVSPLTSPLPLALRAEERTSLIKHQMCKHQMPSLQSWFSQVIQSPHLDLLLAVQKIPEVQKYFHAQSRFHVKGYLR